MIISMDHSSSSLHHSGPVQAIEAAVAASVDHSLRRILVVDDETTIRLALSRFLRTRGFEVEAAESGTAALEALQRQRFSLMLCDLRMPGLSGLEVVPKALLADQDLGIIMLTAVNDATSATEALSNGAFDYLTKPVELPEDPTLWATQPIDRLIAVAQRENGLKPVPPASKLSLLRRAYFDLGVAASRQLGARVN
jgi:CheY-like chemotaxis protein